MRRPQVMMLMRIANLLCKGVELQEGLRWEVMVLLKLIFFQMQSSADTVVLVLNFSAKGKLCSRKVVHIKQHFSNFRFS